MAEPDTAPLILSPAEAKKRFAAYLLLKLTGLAALFAGVYLSRTGINAPGVILLLLGAGSMFVRPRMIGLTTRPEK
ncbi:MAG: hypothetical protein ACOYLS_07860 [Polymorphobacter sp.]